MKRTDFKIQNYWLIAILIIAAILRFYHIDQPYTDVYSWRPTDVGTIADNFYKGNRNIFYPEISWNGPGHNYVGYEFQTISYITALLYHIFGHYDWVGRSVAVLFGLWGIFAFYQLVRRVWTEKHALVAAAVMAILPGEIYINRCFVPDPVMLSLVITSFWLLVAYLQSGRLYYLLLASLVGMLGFLTKISGVIIGIPMLYAIITILNKKGKLCSKQTALICMAGVLMLMPVIAYYLWAIHISHTYPPYSIAAGEYWVWKFGLPYFLERNYFLPKLHYQLNWLWTKPLLVFVAAGFFLRPLHPDNNANPEQPAKNNKAPWIFHYWLLAFVIYYLIGAQGLVSNVTNLNIINPVAAAITAHVLIVISSFVKRIAGSFMSSALIAAFFLWFALAGHKALRIPAARLQPIPENEYKLGIALRQVSKTTDLVITALTSGSTVAIYYSQRRGWQFPPAYSWSSSYHEISDDEAIRLLEDLSSKGADWFGIVIEQKNRFLKDHPTLLQHIENTFERYQERPEFVIYRIPHGN